MSGCEFSAWPAKAGCDGWLGGNNSFSFNVLLCGSQSLYRLMELTGSVKFWPDQ